MGGLSESISGLKKSGGYPSRHPEHCKINWRTDFKEPKRTLLVAALQIHMRPCERRGQINDFSRARRKTQVRPPPLTLPMLITRLLAAATSDLPPLPQRRGQINGISRAKRKTQARVSHLIFARPQQIIRHVRCVPSPSTSPASSLPARMQLTIPRQNTHDSNFVCVFVIEWGLSKFVSRLRRTLEEHECSSRSGLSLFRH